MNKEPKKKLNILIATDIPVYFIAGSNSFVKRLSCLLKKRGHNVAVVCASRSMKHESYTHEDLDIFGIKSFPVLIQKNLRFPLFGIKKEKKNIFKKFKPDVVHVQSHGPIPSAAMKVANELDIAVVGTNHFVPENIFYHFHLPKFVEPVLRKIGWKHMHSIFIKMDYITTPTNTAARLLRESGFTKEVEPISNGIDLSRFTVARDSGESLRKKYNIAKKPTLLYLGRLDPEKNVDVLIKAMPKILKHVDAQLLVVGMGAKEKSLKALTTKLSLNNHVIFTGFLTEEHLASIYNVVDCVVMPGTAELQSIATMEAMATGLPMIAADAMALPELVHHGKNGYLFKPGDSDELAKYAINILTDSKLREAMGKESLAIISKHDIEETVQRFEDVYYKAIDIKKKKIKS